MKHGTASWIAALSLLVAAFSAPVFAQLGSADKDLVYTPVAPCRIMDTRLAGGQLTANTERPVDITAVSNYAFQGGDSTDCGIGIQGSFAALAAIITVYNPNVSGTLKAYPHITSAPTSAIAMAYAAGEVRSNFAIVKLDQGASAYEMNLLSTAQVHVTIDVVGYFINSPATALQCLDTTNIITSVPAGGTANVYAAPCPAGYTQTATNCEAGNWQMPFVYQRNGTCSAQNNGGSAAELRASRTCCRVPGR